MFLYKNTIMYDQLKRLWNGSIKDDAILGAIEQHLKELKVTTPQQFAGKCVPEWLGATQAWLVPHGLCVKATSSGVELRGHVTGHDAAGANLKPYNSSKVIFKMPSIYKYTSVTVAYVTDVDISDRSKVHYIDSDVLYLMELRSSKSDARELYDKHLRPIFAEHRSFFPSLCASADVLTAAAKAETGISSRALIAEALSRSHAYNFSPRLLTYIGDALPFVRSAHLAHGSVFDLCKRYGHLLPDMITPGLLFLMNASGSAEGAGRVNFRNAGRTALLHRCYFPNVTFAAYSGGATHGMPKSGETLLDPGYLQRDAMTPVFCDDRHASVSFVPSQVLIADEYFSNPAFVRDVRTFLHPTAFMLYDYMMRVVRRSRTPNRVTSSAIPLPAGKDEGSLAAYLKAAPTDDSLMLHVHCMAYLFFKSEGAIAPKSTAGVYYHNAVVEEEGSAGNDNFFTNRKTIMERIATDKLAVWLRTNDERAACPYPLGDVPVAKQYPDTETFVYWDESGLKQTTTRKAGAVTHVYLLQTDERYFVYLASLFWPVEESALRAVFVEMGWEDRYVSPVVKAPMKPLTSENLAEKLRSACANVPSKEALRRNLEAVFEPRMDDRTPIPDVYEDMKLFNDARAYALDAAAYEDGMPFGANDLFEIATDARLWSFCRSYHLTSVKTVPDRDPPAETLVDALAHSTFAKVFSHDASASRDQLAKLKEMFAPQHDRRFLYHALSHALASGKYETRQEPPPDWFVRALACECRRRYEADPCVGGVGASEADAGFECAVYDARTVNVYPYLFGDEKRSVGYARVESTRCGTATALVDGGADCASPWRLGDGGWEVISTHDPADWYSLKRAPTPSSVKMLVRRADVTPQFLLAAIIRRHPDAGAGLFSQTAENEREPEREVDESAPAKRIKTTAPEGIAACNNGGLARRRRKTPSAGSEGGDDASERKRAAETADRFVRESGVLEASSEDLFLSAARYLRRACEWEEYDLCGGLSAVYWKPPADEWVGREEEQMEDEDEEEIDETERGAKRWAATVNGILNSTENVSDCVEQFLLVARHLTAYAKPLGRVRVDFGGSVFLLVMAHLYRAYLEDSDEERDLVRACVFQSGLRNGQIAPVVRGVDTEHVVHPDHPDVAGHLCDVFRKR